MLQISIIFMCNSCVRTSLNGIQNAFRLYSICFSAERRIELQWECGFNVRKSNETLWYVYIVSIFDLLALLDATQQGCRVVAIDYCALQKISADPSKIIASKYNKHKNVKMLYQKINTLPQKDAHAHSTHTHTNIHKVMSAKFYVNFCSREKYFLNVYMMADWSILYRYFSTLQLWTKRFYFSRSIYICCNLVREDSAHR